MNKEEAINYLHIKVNSIVENPLSKQLTYVVIDTPAQTVRFSDESHQSLYLASDRDEKIFFADKQELIAFVEILCEKLNVFFLHEETISRFLILKLITPHSGIIEPEIYVKQKQYAENIFH